MPTYDDANFSPFARLKLLGELARIKQDLAGAAALARLKMLRRVNEIRLMLTGAPAAQPQPEPAQPQADARRGTAHLYAFDPARKPAQRKKDNAAALALLARIDSGEVPADSLTDADRALLAKYSGTGGGLVGADGKKGSAYEYYTPKPIAEGVWAALQEMGFSGGKVLDPCAATGIFGAVAPASAAVDAVELNQTSGKVNRMVNGGPGYAVTVAPFERVAASTPDEEYDAVVANVPFGEVADRGGNQLLDPRYQKQPLQNYFILRSLEKLRPGGLGAFIAPPRCLSGKGGKEEWLRQQISYMADFIGAFRLPNSVFGTASADTITDVIFVRKFSAEVAGKVAELREQSPQTLLDASVIWPTFIEGQYFNADGKRFVLGEFQPKNPDKIRDVDRVINPASVEEIGAMLRKLPASRIDWARLDATETLPITYNEGDTITQAGQTLQMQDGRWVALAQTETSAKLAALVGKLTTPYAAFESGASWADAKQCVEFMVKTGQALDVPGWLRDANAQLVNLPAEMQASYWTAGVVGMAVAQVLTERAADGEQVNYLAEYAALSDAMRQQFNTAKKRPGSLAGQMRDGLIALTTYYRGPKTGFHAVWRGDVQEDAPEAITTADASFDGMVYKNQSPWVDAEEAKALFGDGFNHLEDPAWCTGPDGSKVIRADDYYIGNYAEFLARIDVEIAAAKDDAVRAKLLRQKADAVTRVDRLDVKRLTFNLASPLVTPEEKAEFLRRFVHESAYVEFEGGKPRPAINVAGSNLTDRDKLLNRFDLYLKNGSLTLGGAKLSMPDDAALRELRQMAETANEQFAAWVKGNRQIMDRLAATANDPARLRFRQPDDQAALSIPGMSPDLKLHGYQNAFVRRQAREFGGILGDGVGLGKTFQALAAVQWAQSVGVKKKTLFVVPNSVLSNWRKEAGRAYASTDDCLFVGLRERDGVAKVESSAYDVDLASIMENRHSKIFMTMEAFERIRLREETLGGFEQYMRGVDASFAESEDKKADERAKGKAAGVMSVLTSKTGSAPFLEDLGIDSLVMDEAHAYKNSATTVNFKSAKFLSLADTAKRGLDAQAKAWYVRGQSSRQDGVLMLTATPVTNSPLEIYSMLSLAVGHQRMNDACLGVRGADQFMDTVCVKVHEDDVSMDGVPRQTSVFVGLQNVDVLRLAMGQSALVRDAESVGEQVKVPGRDAVETSVALPDSVIKRLMDYKGAFRWAVDDLKNRSPNRGDVEAYTRIAEDLGEPQRLIGHPFNLIKKMERLVMGGHDLDRGVTAYLFSDDQANLAMAAVDELNARGITEERARLGPETSEADVTGKKTIKDGDDETEVLLVRVRARVDAGRIVIDSIQPETQTAFEAIADRLGLGLDVAISPKLAALVENIKAEMASPRGVINGEKSPVVKQIIFCDILAMHNQIRRVLARHCGIPLGKIAVVTGRTNNKPDEIMAVQDGFNAAGAENVYQTVLANEKAEVGVNLQIGTQAIHHLTIGWTPDSLEQRNGRGARQGNQTENIRVYSYDADGTFDSYKRTLVDKKADWISRLMNKDGGDSVAVTGGLSREQMEDLIDCVGDTDSMARQQAAASVREAEARAAANRTRQMVNLSTISKQRAFLADNPDAGRYIRERMMTIWGLRKQARTLQERIDKPGASESAITKNRKSLEAISTRVNELGQEIAQSATIRFTRGAADEMTVDGLMADLSRKSKQRDSDIESALRYQYDITPKEDGKIVAKWQDEVEMAQAMIQESAANFSRQAQESGALPAAVADAATRGEITMLNDGRPVIKGAFVRDGGSLFAVLADGAMLLPASADHTTSKLPTITLVSRLSAAAQIIYPGDSEAVACRQAFADYEDAKADAGMAFNQFSEAIPGVGELRRTEALAEYQPTAVMLPQPYFPYALRDSGSPLNPSSSPARQAIIEQQKAVIRKWNPYGGLVVDASLAVVKTTVQQQDVELAIADYAKAHGLAVDSADLRYYGSVVVDRELAGKLDAFVAALATGTTPDEVNAKADTFMAELMPWFPGAVNSLPVAAKAMLGAAIAAVTPKPSGDEWVAVSFNYTMAEVVVVRKFAEAMGEWAALVNRHGEVAPCDRDVAKHKPNAPPNTWVIKRKVLEAIIEKHPYAPTKYSLKVRA